MIYIWSSLCHCHPVISCFIIQIGLTFLVPAYPGHSREEAVKQVSVLCLHFILMALVLSETIGIPAAEAGL